MHSLKDHNFTLKLISSTSNKLLSSIMDILQGMLRCIFSYHNFKCWQKWRFYLLCSRPDLSYHIQSTSALKGAVCGYRRIYQCSCALCLQTECSHLIKVSKFSFPNNQSRGFFTHLCSLTMNNKFLTFLTFLIR